MEGGQIMVVLIVAIVMVASIIRAKYGYSRHGRRVDSTSPEDRAENLRLREEVKELKERLKVLERIAVEKENSLSREIENLRDR
jgi:cell division protein FtsL